MLSFEISSLSSISHAAEQLNKYMFFVYIKTLVKQIFSVISYCVPSVNLHLFFCIFGIFSSKYMSVTGVGSKWKSCLWFFSSNGRCDPFFSQSLKIFFFSYGPSMLCQSSPQILHTLTVCASYHIESCYCKNVWTASIVMISIS